MAHAHQEAMDHGMERALLPGSRRMLRTAE